MSAVSASLGSANDIRTDYLNLLITQLRNQNPLEPMDNGQMATQLAQLSQLEQLENMNSTFQKVLLAQQVAQASELIGKQVLFSAAGQDGPLVGVVDGVEVADGQVRLKIGTRLIDLDEVQAIGGTNGLGAQGRNALPAEFTQAATLIGKEVSFVPDEHNSPVGQKPPEEQTEISGRVDGVEVIDGQVRVNVGDYKLYLGDIRSVRD